MSGSKTKQNRQKQILRNNPACYFCGGKNPSTTIDHVPPKACFPDTHYLEDFELAAFKARNAGASKDDQIFGLYSMLLDFDDRKLTSAPDLRVLNNYTDALPEK